MASSLGLLSLGLSPLVTGLLVTLFVVICVLLILIVLIQRPQGGGLAGAFGMGAGSSQTAFGAKTGDALTFATIGIFVFYIIAAVGLNFALAPGNAAPPTPEAVSTDPASDAVPSPTGGATAPAPTGGALPSIQVDPVPAPTTPAPTTPAPAEPAPTTPAPTEPAPTEPAPAEPAPQPEPQPDQR